nr:hypothetical protein [Tanacetum cinerariifolium]
MGNRIRRTLYRIPEKDERETPADFLPEIPFDDSEKRVKEKEVSDPRNEWKLYTDGASSSDGAGARIMLIDPASKEYTYALRFEFETTNNEAEYETLLAGLHIGQEMEITKVAIFLDSQLVKADALSKLASMTFEHLTKEVLVKVLAKRSIEEKEVLKVEIKEKRNWMSPIQEYLLSGLLSEDTKEARKIRIQVPQYKLIRGTIRNKESMDGWSHYSWKYVAFQSLGIHFLGPLPMAPGGLQFLVIIVEHSTKWVEAKPTTVKNIRQMENFAWEYVVCRFGVPQMINSKEEKHFKEGIFADFCKGLKITRRFSPITEQWK